jgi:hypothetical protein
MTWQLVTKEEYRVSVRTRHIKTEIDEAYLVQINGFVP